MLQTPEQDEEQVRVGKGGIETVPRGGSAVKAGFGDRKKVLILAVLLTVGAGVAAYQFLGGSGPQEAAAVSAAAPAPGGRAVNPTDVERVLEHLDAGPQNGTEQGLSIGRVEEIVNTFDTYVQTRQVPLEGLRVNPFAVVRSESQQDAQEQAQAAEEAEAEEAEAEARRSRMLAAARALKVGSILIVGDERKAIVAGKLCQVGDTIEGFHVEAIDTDCVRLSVEGETVELRLRPETDGR